MSLKKIEPVEPIMKSHKNHKTIQWFRRASDSQSLPKWQLKIFQISLLPTFICISGNSTKTTFRPRRWFPMAKDPWWTSSLTIVVGLEPFYKKRWKKMQFQYHPFVEGVGGQNCGRTHPTFTHHPLQWVTRKQRYVNNETGIWHAILSCCISILLFNDIHDINMKLCKHDITENRTWHLHISIIISWIFMQKTPCTSHKILLTKTLQKFWSADVQTFNSI